MATVTVSITDFRQRFPVFSDTTKYPDSLIQAMLDTAPVYISNKISCCRTEAIVKEALLLMTAHLVAINSPSTTESAGGGVIQSAHIGDVSVTKMAPPAKTSFAYWLSSTPYGLQLLALLKTQATIGLYIGGTAENVFR